MKTSLRQLFLGVAVAVFFALTFAALAQEPAPAPAAPPPAAPATDVEKSTPPAPPATAPAAETPAPEPPSVAPATPAEPEKPATLRRLDAAPTDKNEPASDDNATPAKRARRPARGHGDGSDRVSVMGDVHVLADESVEGAAVGVMGDVTIDGEVSGDAVAVLGDNTINGTVTGNAVAVLGDVRLGAHARVGGDVTCIGGDVIREPGAQIGGRIIKKAGAGNLHVAPGLDTWWTHGLRLGRPLAIGPGLIWQWILTAFTLAFYALLALVFPGGIRKCGDALVRRPGAVIGSSILTMLALPVMFVLLLITIVGIPVALLFLPASVVLGVMFGKAALYALVGRAVSNDRLHPALSVLVGAVPFVLLFLVPVAGLMLWMLISLLGLGCVVTTLFSSEKKSVSPGPAAPTVANVAMPAPSSAAASTAAGTMGFAAVAPETGAAAVAPLPLPLPLPPFSAASQPRAGFWIRLGALLIDAILIGVIFIPMGLVFCVPFLLALYAAAMWKVKGTTIGGIVCGLQVVRFDERPLDWPTVIVRALGSFLSLIVAGLGFIWVVFDPEKQSWHDKIAGTTVVCTTKRTSLV